MLIDRFDVCTTESKSIRASRERKRGWWAEKEQKDAFSRWSTFLRRREWEDVLENGLVNHRRNYKSSTL